MWYQEHVSLYGWTSFRVPTTAAYGAICSHPEELPYVHKLLPLREHPLVVLGNGSNILFATDYPGIVLRPLFRGIHLLEYDEDTVQVEVAAGEPWHEFVYTCLRNGWYGLENLALIPGTVGAAPVHNIGAYGVEVSQFLEGVRVWDFTTEQLCWLPAEELLLRYRSSILRETLLGKVLVTHVRFRLYRRARPKVDYPELARFLSDSGIAYPTAEDVFRAVCAIRRCKLPDPAHIPNAGSFFKNPVLPLSVAEELRQRHPALPTFPHGSDTVKIPAGWLLEQCGWKGKRIGNVGVWQHHALVIVNYGAATGEEILRFAELLWRSVYDRFGITLEPEVLILPREAWNPSSR